MTTRRHLLRLWPVLLIAAAVPALAHEDATLTGQTAWAAWHLTPDIVIPTALVAIVYIVGLLRRRAITEPLPPWRHAAFFGGLAAVFLSLQSPIDPIAERLFWMHQIQHLLLRTIGPMMIALAWPQGILSAGLRATLGGNVLKPLASNGPLRSVFRFLARPAVATILFIAALYVWEVPRYHNLALVNEAVHYVMHVTMLVAGILFWWRIFDRRPAPQGLGYGMRLMMLWVVTLSNIVLGAYTTLRSDVLYSAYDVTGRLFGYSALGDEQLGGIDHLDPGEHDVPRRHPGRHPYVGPPGDQSTKRPPPRRSSALPTSGRRAGAAAAAEEPGAGVRLRRLRRHHVRRRAAGRRAEQPLRTPGRQPRGRKRPGRPCHAWRRGAEPVMTQDRPEDTNTVAGTGADVRDGPLRAVAGRKALRRGPACAAGTAWWPRFSSSSVRSPLPGC